MVFITVQPAWGVRTMLEAIVSFLPSEGHGAIGALDWTPKERAKLAKEVRRSRTVIGREQFTGLWGGM